MKIIDIDDEGQPFHIEWDIDPNKCPTCGGVPDNGYDREYPPNPYACTKCEKRLK